MDGYITIGTELDTKQFDAQILALERKVNDIEKQLEDPKKLGLGSEDVQQLEVELERTKNKLVQLNKEKAKLEQSNAMRDLNFNVEGLGNSFENAIKKVGRLVMGVFSIRTAFTAISRASNELASYNPQYAANIEYIRYALTQLIAPVLEYILNLAKTILAYINYIANAWFGVNLFANASAKNFEKVKKGIGGASSAAKELQKTLTGFDEMNILNSSSTGGGGGVGGAVSPDFDLADLDSIVIPPWIEWIAKNKDIVIGAIAGIASAFLIFKTLKIFGILEGIGGALKNMITKLGALKGTIATLGIVTFITGIMITIKGIIDYIKDPSWDNFRQILIGLGVAAGGLAAALIAVNAQNPLGWIMLAISAVSFLTTLIGDLIQDMNEETRTQKVLKESTDRLTDARNKLNQATDNYVNAVDRAEQAEKDLQIAQEETGISATDLIKKMEDENLTYKDLNEQQRRVYKAYLDNKNAQDNLNQSTKDLTDAEANQKEELYKLVTAYKSNSTSAEDYKNKIVEAYNKGEISAREAADAISIALGDVDEDTRKSFMNTIPDAIKEGLNPDKYQAQANSFSSWWNNQMYNLKSSTNGIFGSMANTAYRELSRMNSYKSSFGFKTGGYVTKLASGGLINMPNRGVPVTNTIAGEAGAEGIIPLTDQQAMAQLGAEIGRNVLVNLTNITSMNGRVISRELRTIQSEEDFAFNT